MTKLLNFSTSPNFINQYIPLWLTTRSLVMLWSPHNWFSFIFCPIPIKRTIMSSIFVPFWLTLFLIHKLMDKQLPPHTALDNGMTSPGWCHHHMQLLTQWSRSQHRILWALGRRTATLNLQHGYHKIQTNKVINYEGKQCKLHKMWGNSWNTVLQ